MYPNRLVGYTTDRELHPAPKVLFSWGDYNAYALTMQSTGQASTQRGVS